MKQGIIFFLVFCFSFKASGIQRDSTSFLSAGIQGHYGFIIPHSNTIRDISHTNPFGFELSLNRLHTSPEHWSVFNAFWSSGIQARYFNYQNPEILGSVFDLTAYAEPVVRHGRNFRFTIRGGTGISFHTRIYDPVDNPMNYFFSSRFSFPVYVDARLRYKFGERTFFLLSGSYNHISNGGIKKPNKGMNFPTMSVGLENYLKPIPELQDIYTPDIVEKRLQSFFITQYLMSVKAYGGFEVPKKTTFVHGLHARFAKPLGPFYALNAGAEFFIDGYLRERLLRNDLDADHKRFAMTAGQEFMLGNILFTQYLGVYLYSPAKPPDPVYQKYELAYRLGEHLMLGVYVKAHLHVAGLMGVHLNLRFPGK